MQVKIEIGIFSISPILLTVKYLFNEAKNAVTLPFPLFLFPQNQFTENLFSFSRQCRH